MNLILIGLLLLLLCYISFTDIKRREIDHIPLAIILLLSVLIGLLVTHNINIIVPLAILVIGIILSCFNLLGGGDVKLLVALSVGLTNEMVLHLFILTSFAGVPVAIGAYIIHKIKKKTGSCEVPYGLAISIGYVFMLIGSDIKLF